MKYLWSFLLALGIYSIAIAQEKPHSPKPGTAERKAIVNALRAPIEKELKKKVIFKVSHLRVQGDYAFLSGQPLQPDGKALSYKGTKYQAAIDAGAFDNNVFALFKRGKEKWKVLRYVIGATDVPWVEWPKEFKAPKAIFPGLLQTELSPTNWSIWSTVENASPTQVSAQP